HLCGYRMESKITNKCLHNSCIIKICPYGLK
ncbi:hypothetical protein AB9C36_21745, partial [Escherichia coli]